MVILLTKTALMFFPSLCLGKNYPSGLKHLSSPKQILFSIGGQNEEELITQGPSCWEKLFCRKPRLNDGPNDQPSIGEPSNTNQGCFQRFSIYCRSCNEMIDRRRRHYIEPNSFGMSCLSGRNEEQYRPIIPNVDHDENGQES